MIKIKNLSIRNFLSVGNVTQNINFNREELVLLLGENLDLGGEDAGCRNGVGKCICTNSIVRVKNSKTGEIIKMTIGDLYNVYKENKEGKT